MAGKENEDFKKEFRITNFPEPTFNLIKDYCEIMGISRSAYAKQSLKHAIDHDLRTYNEAPKPSALTLKRGRYD